MGQIVDDLLAFSRLGRQALSVGPVDMTELVREIWEEAINVGGSNAELKLGDVALFMLRSHARSASCDVAA